MRENQQGGNSMRGFIKTITLAVLVLLAKALAVAAQQLGIPESAATSAPGAVLDGDISPDQLTELVLRMSDDDLRAFVVEQLKMLTASGGGANEAPVTLIDRLTNLWTMFTDPILTAIARLPILFDRQADAFGVFVEAQGGSTGTFALFGLMALILAVAYGVERSVRWYLGRSLHVAAQEGEPSLLASLQYLFGRLIREVFGLVVFIVVARILGRFVLDPTQLAFAGPFFSYLVLMPRVGAALSRFIMAPSRPDLRLVTIDDGWAGFIHRNIIGLMLLGGFNIFALNFSFNNGIAPGETRLGFWIDLCCLSLPHHYRLDGTRRAARHDAGVRSGPHRL